MRVIGNMVHAQCNITFFHWNNRYLIKLEAGPFEQTFKIQEYDLTSEEDLKKIIICHILCKNMHQIKWEFLIALKTKVHFRD